MYALALYAYRQQMAIAAALDASFSRACGSLNRFDDADKLSDDAKRLGSEYAAHSDVRAAAFQNLLDAGANVRQNVREHR